MNEHLPGYKDYVVPTIEHVRTMHSHVPTAWWHNTYSVSTGHSLYAQGNDPCYLCVLLMENTALKNEIADLRHDLERCMTREVDLLNSNPVDTRTNL